LGSLFRFVIVQFLHFQSSYRRTLMLGPTYHRRAVAQPCVNGDRLSKGRMAKFDPTQIRNPWTDRHKIWNRWLRPRDDPRAKFRANSSIGGFSANGWNI